MWKGCSLSQLGVARHSNKLSGGQLEKLLNICHINTIFSSLNYNRLANHHWLKDGKGSKLVMCVMSKPCWWKALCICRPTCPWPLALSFQPAICMVPASLLLPGFSLSTPNWQSLEVGHAGIPLHLTSLSMLWTDPILGAAFWVKVCTLSPGPTQSCHCRPLPLHIVICLCAPLTFSRASHRNASKWRWSFQRSSKRQGCQGENPDFVPYEPLPNWSSATVLPRLWSHSPRPSAHTGILYISRWITLHPRAKHGICSSTNKHRHSHTHI